MESPDDRFPYVDIHIPTKYYETNPFDELREWLSINARGHYIMDHCPINSKHVDGMHAVCYRFKFMDERDATLFAVAFKG